MSDGVSVSVDPYSNTAVSNSINKRDANGELGKDAFLQLLVTQLQYQDPLSPMDNTQFVAQTAQFTALEQMQNLNTTMTNAQAFNVIGKNVYAYTYDSATGKSAEYEGIVDSVSIKNGKPYVKIGENEVAYSDVKSVYSATDYTSSMNNNMVVSQAMSLIGKNILAILVDENNKAAGYVEGKVDFVKFVDDVPVLSVGGKDVRTYEVISVSDEDLLIGKEISYAVSKDETESGAITDISFVTTTSKSTSEESKEATTTTQKVYMNVNGKLIEVQDINSIISSLAYVGKEVKSKSVSGTVDGVVVRDTKPYLVVGDKEVAYSDISK